MVKSHEERRRFEIAAAPLCRGSASGRSLALESSCAAAESAFTMAGPWNRYYKTDLGHSRQRVLFSFAQPLVSAHRPHGSNRGWRAGLLRANAGRQVRTRIQNVQDPLDVPGR